MSSLTSSEFSELKEIYNNFKQELKLAIKSKNITKNKECYLIKKQWDTEIDKSFNNNSNNNRFRKYKHSNINNNSVNLPNEPPKFINDFNTLKECLKNGEQIILESYDLIESVMKKYSLKVKCIKNYFVYYAKNNKIILEYPNKNELLLIEMATSIVEGISNKEQIHKISYHKRFGMKESSKQELYEYLLSNNNIKDLKLDYNNCQIKILKTEIDILKEDNDSETPSLHKSFSSFLSQRPGGLSKKKEESNSLINEPVLETPKEELEVEKGGFKSRIGYRKRFHRQNQSVENITSGENINSIKDNGIYEQNGEKHNEPLTKSRWNRSRQLFNQKEKNTNLNIQNTVDIEELKRENEKLKKNNIALKDEINELKEKYDKLNKDALNSQKEITNLNRDLQSLKKKLNDKDKKIENLQNDLNNINKDGNTYKFQSRERNFFSRKSRFENTSQQILEKDYQKNIDNLEREKKDLLNKKRKEKRKKKRD